MVGIWTEDRQSPSAPQFGNGLCFAVLVKSNLQVMADTDQWLGWETSFLGLYIVQCNTCQKCGEIKDGYRRSFLYSLA